MHGICTEKSKIGSALLQTLGRLDQDKVI